MLVKLYFETKYKPKRLCGKSQRTKTLYIHSINNFGITLGRDPVLEDFTDENIAKHMDRLQRNGRQPATINKDYNQLLAIWRHVCRAGILSVWPDILAMPEPRRTPVAWLKHELEQILKTFKTLDGEICGIPEPLYWTGLTYMFVESAERSGAVFQAEWSWIRGTWIYVPGEARKGGRADKSFELTDHTLAILQKIKAVSTDHRFIFPWHYHPSYRWKRYGTILEKAGLPATGKDKFHKLRKTTASVLHQAGMNAQDALGHERYETTKKYIDPRFGHHIPTSRIVFDWLHGGEGGEFKC